MTNENVGGLAADLDVNETTQDAPLEVDPRETKEVVRIESDETKVPTERPETLPEQFWDEKEGKIKVNALAEQHSIDQKRITDLRKTISKGVGGTPAEAIDDYVVEFSEEVAKFLPEEDGALGVAKKAALEAGIPVEQFKKFAPAYMEGLLEAGLINEDQLAKSPEEAAEAEAKQIEQHREEQMKILGDGAEKKIERLTDRVSSLYKKGALNKEDVQAFKEAAFDAKGVLFLEKWIDLHSGAQQIPTEYVLDEGLATRDELDAMAGDPRMSDPAFRAKRSAGYAALEARGAL